MSRGGADARNSTGGSAGADPSAPGGEGAEPSTGYGALFRLALPSILLQSGAPLAITVQTALLGRKDTQLVAAWAVVASEFAETAWNRVSGHGDARAGHGDARAGRGDARTGHGDARAGRGDARAGHGDARVGHGDARAGRGDARAGHGDSRVGHGDARAGHGDARVGHGDARVGHGDARVGHGDALAGHGDARVGHGNARVGHGDARVGHGDARAGHGDARAGHGDARTGRGDARVGQRDACVRHGDACVGPTDAATNAATVIFNFLVVGVTAKVTKVVAVGAWAQVGVRIRLAFAMALATSAVAVALLLCSQGLLWALLNDSPSVLQYAKSYFYLRVMGVPPQLLVMCTSGVLQGYKHVALVAWLQAARALLDVAASYLSLYVLDWGIVGVGIGTFLASCTVAAVSIACILLLPPPQGKGKIVVFPPILSFLARKVTVPQVLLCRALSQRVSRTCSKVRVGGAAALADAQMLLLDGREREGAGKEVGMIEERVLELLEGRMFKAGRGVVSEYQVDQRPDGCGRSRGAGEKYEQAIGVGGREEGRDEEGSDAEMVGKEGEADEEGRGIPVVAAKDSRLAVEEHVNERDENAYNEDNFVGVDGRGAMEGGCAEHVEVRVVVGREETSTMLLLKTEKEERVEKRGSVGREKGGSAEGKCKAEEMEEERINEVLNESTWTFLWDGLSTILRSTLVQVCATADGWVCMCGCACVGVHVWVLHVWVLHVWVCMCGCACVGVHVWVCMCGCACVRVSDSLSCSCSPVLPSIRHLNKPGLSPTRPSTHPLSPSQLSFFLVLACATSLGVHAVAAHQILMQLWMVNIYIADGFATAGTIVASSLAGRMAQAQTRGEHAALLADLRLTCWRVLRMGLMAGILICVAYIFLEHHIVALFTYDETTRAQLKHVWLFLALMQPLNSVVFVYDGLIYAAQAFSYMAACLAVGFFTLFLPVVFPPPFVYRLPLLLLLLPPASLAAFPFPFHQLPLLLHLFPSLPSPFFQFRTLLAAWAAKGVLNTMT
ncbi:unnamed protein product [Closterium sp. Naga37s-1]|nr:unnamed protein product [Closterium sp. Naga37s-1]